MARKTRPGKKARQTIELACKNFQTSLKIGNKIFEFESSMLDLEEENLSELNEMITKIPGHIAYVGQAYAEIEKYDERLSREYDAWSAAILAGYDEMQDGKGKPIFSTEASKTRHLVQEHASEYDRRKSEMAEAAYLLRLVKTLYHAVEAKYSLAQTLCANLRPEYQSHQYD